MDARYCASGLGDQLSAQRSHESAGMRLLSDAAYRVTVATASRKGITIARMRLYIVEDDSGFRRRCKLLFDGSTSERSTFLKERPLGHCHSLCGLRSPRQAGSQVDDENQLQWLPVSA